MEHVRRGHLFEGLQGDGYVAAGIDAERPLAAHQREDQQAAELRRLIQPVAGVEGVAQLLALAAHAVAEVADNEHLQGDSQEEHRGQHHGGEIMRVGHIEEVHGHGALDGGGAEELGEAGDRQDLLDGGVQLDDVHEVLDAVVQLQLHHAAPGRAIGMARIAEATHAQLQGAHVAREHAEVRRRIGVVGTVLDGLDDQAEQLIAVDEHVRQIRAEPVDGEPGGVEQPALLRYGHPNAAEQGADDKDAGENAKASPRRADSLPQSLQLLGMLHAQRPPVQHLEQLAYPVELSAHQEHIDELEIGRNVGDRYGQILAQLLQIARQDEPRQQRQRKQQCDQHVQRNGLDQVPRPGHARGPYQAS